MPLISRIFTTEPEMTRALAAEIRHNPKAFTSLLEDRLGRQLPDATGVECEANEGIPGTGRIDIVITFGLPESATKVGIEAKFDHEISSHNLDAYRQVTDSLLLLVLDEADAKGHEDEVDGIITWEQAVGCFPGSRILLDDVINMPDYRRQVERHLNQELDRMSLPRGWRSWVERGGSGMPSIGFQSPTLPDGRWVGGQVQVTGRGATPPLDIVRFEYNIGVSVPDDDENYPPPTTATRPDWMRYLVALDDQVLRDRHQKLLVSKYACGNGPAGTRRANKKPLVDKFMPGRSWLAKGYTDGWVLGIKSQKVLLANLPRLCDITVCH